MFIFKKTCCAWFISTNEWHAFNVTSLNMSKEQIAIKHENSVTSFTDMSTLKCKKQAPVPSMKQSITKDKSEEDIAVIEQSLESRSSHLMVPVPEKDISATPIFNTHFRRREPKAGPSLRPRGSKRSTMTWPGCR